MQETNSKTIESDAQPAKRKSRHIGWIMLLAAVILAIGWYFFFSGRNKHAAKPVVPPIPVLAEAAKKTNVGVYLEGLGSVTPLNTVTVHTRINGQLMEVRFREGQFVNRGFLLAVIDPRPYEVQLTQAEGQMVHDTELLKNARIDLKRYQQLWAQNSIPKQQLDTQDSLVHQYEGTVKNDQGLIDSAKLQLVYCRITAPVSGRVGLRQVDPGNIVQTTDTTGLVVITQEQPTTVIFPLPEDILPDVLTKLKSNVLLTVDVYDRTNKLKLATGKLLTVDNQIDPTTGTVKFKAIFPNTDNRLFPNQFVNARLLLEIKRQAVIVASSAIQRGPEGTFVYLVKADHTVTVRPITAGVVQGDNTSISSGLEEGDLVVVDGAERLREGSRVDLKGSKKGSKDRNGVGGGQNSQNGQNNQAGKQEQQVQKPGATITGSGK